jgi:hypothetical protein
MVVMLAVEPATRSESCAMVSDDIRDRILAYVREQAAKPREDLIEHVASNQQQFLALIADVDDDRAARRSGPDEWSLRELTRHVVLAQDSVATIIESLGRGDAVAGDALGEAGSMLADDDRRFSAYVARVRETNARVLDAIRGLSASPDLAVIARHPWLGPLNCLEWAANQIVHDADHVQHARKIVAAVDSA